jgi:hypothetical protein
MQRHVVLITEHPTVVPWRDAEQISRPHATFGAIAHPDRGATRNDEPDVFDLAQLAADQRTYVLRPSPAGRVNRPPDLQITDGEEVESAERKNLCSLGHLRTYDL